ncbi:MAG: hypothetical protein OCD01_05425 [Fibrobacterales bacterium]
MMITKLIFGTALMAATAFAGTYTYQHADASVGLPDGVRAPYKEKTITLDTENEIIAISVTMSECKATLYDITTYTYSTASCNDWELYDVETDYRINGNNLYQVGIDAKVRNPNHTSNLVYSGNDIFLTIAVEYTSTSVFDANDRSLNLTLENTEWADIHYTINDGGQLNYRMIKTGESAFKQELFQNIVNGDVIEYYTTSFTNGGIESSQWSTTTVSGIVPVAEGSYTPATQTLALTAIKNLQWVDVHYSINGSSQYNYRMSGSQKYFSFVIPQIVTTNDIIEYNFTYSLNGVSTNTASQTVTH